MRVWWQVSFEPNWDVMESYADTYSYLPPITYRGEVIGTVVLHGDIHVVVMTDEGTVRHVHSDKVRSEELGTQ